MPCDYVPGDRMFPEVCRSAGYNKRLTAVFTRSKLYTKLILA